MPLWKSRVREELYHVRENLSSPDIEELYRAHVIWRLTSYTQVVWLGQGERNCSCLFPLRLCCPEWAISKKYARLATAMACYWVGRYSWSGSQVFSKLEGGWEQRPQVSGILKIFYTITATKLTFICVDALDECVPECWMVILELLGQIVQVAVYSHIRDREIQYPEWGGKEIG